MSTQDQIARLQGLLGRVQKNATLPRMRAVAAPVAAAPTPPEPEPVPEEEAEPLVPMDEPVLMAEPEVAEAELAEAELAPAEIAAPEPAPEETSMVRAIEAPAEEEEVAVEMGEAAIEDLDLLEEEIVDITEAAPGEQPAPAEEIEPPASSRRPIAGSMGEALAGAAETVEMDEGREIPLKTPPPESGPQAAPPPGLAAPALPDLGELGEPELVSGAQPTAAQLGATVDLEPAAEAELELGEPVIEAPPLHAVRVEAAPAALPEPVQPEVFQRPALATAPAGAFVSAARSFHPHSFAELLDASLALGRD